jgi:hypothetical protein
MKSQVLAVVWGLLVSAPISAADKVPAAARQDVLTAGTYTAKVKALKCGGCGRFIQKTLQQNSQLEKIAVDQKTKTLTFSVRNGQQVKVEDIQKALTAASNKMGKGADYSLSELTLVKNP